MGHPTSVPVLKNFRSTFHILLIFLLLLKFSSSNSSVTGEETKSLPKNKESDYQQTSTKPPPVPKNVKNLTFTRVPPKKISQNVSDISFLIYSNPLNVDYFEEVSLQELSTNDSKFLPDRPVKVLIHGFTQDRSTEFPKQLKNAYLDMMSRKGDNEKFNILIMDWGQLAAAPVSLVAIRHYKEAVDNVKAVGKYLAKLLLRLQETRILKNFENVHIVGFSLGAHVGGVTGRELFLQAGEKVGRITGLDPAGPLFYRLPDEERLDSADANFVDVIHTNAGRLGSSLPLAHIDIFPNGGRYQPGCGDDWTGICSHQRAHLIYRKSVYDAKALVACKCDSWEEFHKCVSNCTKVEIGEHCPMIARGFYYLEV